nr:flavodoxin domain-containing protein [Streptomyces flavochromogenes]
MALPDPAVRWSASTACEQALGKHDLSGYDGVVLGGALYAGHWTGKARRCARRNAEELRQRPVWLFSSGPVDSSAEQHDIPPV